MCSQTEDWPCFSLAGRGEASERRGHQVNAWLCSRPQCPTENAGRAQQSPRGADGTAESWQGSWSGRARLLQCDSVSPLAFSSELRNPPPPRFPSPRGLKAKSERGVHSFPCLRGAWAVKPPAPVLQQGPEPQAQRGPDAKEGAQGRGHGPRALAVRPRAARPALLRGAETGTALWQTPPQHRGPQHPRQVSHPRGERLWFCPPCTLRKIFQLTNGFLIDLSQSSRIRGNSPVTGFHCSSSLH